MTKKTLGFTLCFLLSFSAVSGQNVSLDDHFSDFSSGIRYNLEAQVTSSKGATPLWLSANKHGLSSIESNNGYFRAAMDRSTEADSTKNWKFGFGLDAVVAYGFTSELVIQQMYVETAWKKLRLSIGSKERACELKPRNLSTGSQTLGINARPIPQIRLEVPEYWALSFTKDWLSLKGHLSYGITTDDNWQEEFSQCRSRYTQNTLYHSKAGFIKIGKEKRPLSLELGLEMATQFGGTSYIPENGGTLSRVENEGGLKGCWNALIPSGSEAIETIYKNSPGNHLGSWLFRLNLDLKKCYLGLYGEQFFEDHSAMFHLDYDGYGSGTEWEKKVSNKYLGYPFKDMMLGAELKLKKINWLNNIVVEYIYTKYQSGPIYHDHTANISDHIGGRDYYYNSYIYTGWQHWGQVIGNPLYLSPIYNEDGKIEVKNNRMYGFHLGLSGNPVKELNYRVMATWQKGFGRYDLPYDSPRENISVLAEAMYSFPEDKKMSGWSICLAAGMDKGRMRGDNYGMQLTIKKNGFLNFSGTRK